jgi:hypothetical protein
MNMVHKRHAAREDKNRRIRQSLRATQKRRQNQRPLTIFLKLQNLPKRRIARLQRAFLEGKWLWNWLVEDSKQLSPDLNKVKVDSDKPRMMNGEAPGFNPGEEVTPLACATPWGIAPLPRSALGEYGVGDGEVARPVARGVVVLGALGERGQCAAGRFRGVLRVTLQPLALPAQAPAQGWGVAWVMALQ